MEKNLDDFLEIIFEDVQILTKEEFFEKTSLNKLYDKFDNDDIRKKTFPSKEEFIEFYYELLFVNKDKVWTEFFNKRLKFKKYTEPKYTEIVDDVMIIKPHKSGHFRNICLKNILETKAKDGVNLLTIFRNIYTKGKVERNFTMPSVFKDLIKDDLSTLVVTLKTVCGLPSIFFTN